MEELKERRIWLPGDFEDGRVGWEEAFEIGQG